MGAELPKSEEDASEGKQSPFGSSEKIAAIIACVLGAALITTLLCTGKISETSFSGLTVVLLATGLLVPNIDRLGSFSFGKLVVRLEKAEARIKKAERKIKWTEEAIRTIVAYRPGHFAHLALKQIQEKSGPPYDDSQSDTKRLWLLLLDDGYLQPLKGRKTIEFPWDEKKDTKEKKVCLHEIAELTTMAELLLELRKQEDERRAKP